MYLDAVHKHDLGVYDWQADVAKASLKERIWSSALLLLNWVIRRGLFQRLPSTRPVTS